MLQMDTDKHRLKLTFRQSSIHFLKHLSCSGVVRLKSIPACTDRVAGFIRTIMYRLRNAFTFTLRLTQYFRVFSSSNLHVLRLWGKLKHLKKAHTQTPPSCYDQTVLTTKTLLHLESSLWYFRKLHVMFLPFLFLTLRSHLSDTPMNSSVGPTHKVLSDLSNRISSVCKTPEKYDNIIIFPCHHICP